ncbi:MAG: DUF6438 domain-containing protein [Bacteroidota bacterium]
MRIYLVLSLLVINLLPSCNATRSISSDDLVFEIEKTSCYGTCPVYTMTIYKDRTVILNAQQNLEWEGVYMSELSDGRYNELINMFVKERFFEFQDRYTSNITDLPTTYVTFRHQGKSKKIMDYHQAPEALKTLEEELHGLIAELTWKEKNKN